MRYGSKPTRGYKRVFMAAAMMFTATIGTTTPAQADARACSYQLGYPGYNYYCAEVTGRNEYVRYVRGEYALSNQNTLCNWSVTAEFFDRNWNWYQTIESPRQGGCSRTGSATIWTQNYFREGFLCSTLKSNSRRVTSACVRIIINN